MSILACLNGLLACSTVSGLSRKTLVVVIAQQLFFDMKKTEGLLRVCKTLISIAAVGLSDH